MVLTLRAPNEANRFRMLETVRQYAHEKLVDEGESESVRARHLAYYRRWIEDAAPKIRGREQVRMLDQLVDELDNLRLALEWALRTDVEAELEMAAALIWFWHIRSYGAEGIAWLEQGLDRLERDPGLISAVDPLMHGRAMSVLGFHRWLQLYSVSSQVDYAPERAKDLLTKAITLYQALDPEQNQEAKLGLTWANLWLGFYLRDVEGEPDLARTLAQGAMETFQAAGDLLGKTECLQLMGFCSDTPDDQIGLFQEQLSIYEKMMDTHGISKTHGYIGNAAGRNGEYAIALESFKEALAYARQVNHRDGIYMFSLMVGDNLHALGEFSEAEDYLQQSLSGWRDIGLENRVVWSLRSLSQLRMVQGRYDLAAGVIDQAWEIARRSENNASQVLVLSLRSRLARIQENFGLAMNYLKGLPAAGFSPHYQEITIPLEWGSLALQTGDLAKAGRWLREALKYVDNSYQMYLPPFFDGTATYAARMAMMESAARLFGSRWCRAYEHFLSPIEETWREDDWTAMRNVLGEEGFERLYADGQSMTYEQALTLVKDILEE